MMNDKYVRHVEEQLRLSQEMIVALENMNVLLRKRCLVYHRYLKENGYQVLHDDEEGFMKSVGEK